MPRIRRIRRKKPRAGSVWKKLLLWGVLGLLVLAAAVVAGSYLYVRAYLKSDGFLAMLEQSAVDDMNVETARIDPLDWDGSGIRCGGVTMEGHEFLTSLQARNIETEFSRWELLKRAFVITSVNIAELKLRLAPVPFRFREKPEGARSWAEENILPDTFRLEKGSIDSLSVSYGEVGQLYVLDGTRVESAYDAGSSQYRFEMQGGRLLLPFKGCPEFSLMSGTAQFNHASRRVNVPSCRLTTAAGGYLDIKGDWDGSSSSWTANMVVNGVPASSVLEDHWKKHVQGSVSGGIDLRGGRDGVTHVAGLARLQGGMLTGLPVLDRLALFCGSSRFRNLPLHEASAQFTYQESAWHISNILVESENLVRVEGWLEIGKGGALTGRLQVGLRADGLWKALPGFSDVFSVSRQGAGGNLAWANVNIGGTLDNPSEDLSARLIKAAGNRLTEIGMGKAAEVADVAARLLNRGTGENGAGDGAERNGRKFRIPAGDGVPVPVVPRLQDAAEKGLKTGNDLMNELMIGNPFFHMKPYPCQMVQAVAVIVERIADTAFRATLPNGKTAVAFVEKRTLP